VLSGTIETPIILPRLRAAQSDADAALQEESPDGLAQRRHPERIQTGRRRGSFRLDAGAPRRRCPRQLSRRPIAPRPGRATPELAAEPGIQLSAECPEPESPRVRPITKRVDDIAAVAFHSAGTVYFRWKGSI
jgi:hypothetical protein